MKAGVLRRGPSADRKQGSHARGLPCLHSLRSVVSSQGGDLTGVEMRRTDVAISFLGQRLLCVNRITPPDVQRVATGPLCAAWSLQVSITKPRGVLRLGSKKGPPCVAIVANQSTVDCCQKGCETGYSSLRPLVNREHAGRHTRQDRYFRSPDA